MASNGFEFFRKDEARDNTGKWTSGGSSGEWSHANKHFAHVSTPSGKVKMTPTPDSKVPVKTGPHPDHATAVNKLREQFPAETKGQTITSGWGLDAPHNDMQWTKPDRLAKSDPTIDTFIAGMK